MYIQYSINTEYSKKQKCRLQRSRQIFTTGWLVIWATLGNRQTLKTNWLVVRAKIWFKLNDMMHHTINQTEVRNKQGNNQT